MNMTIQRKIDVQQPWDELITQNLKTIEGRVSPPEKWSTYKNQNVQMGSNVVKIIDVVHYPDLDSYLLECWEKAAPQTKSFDEAKQCYLNVVMNQNEKVFSPERIEKEGGITALHIKLV